MAQTLNLVLLGGSGFVGRALLRELACLPPGSVAVRALLRNPASTPDYPFMHKVQGSLETLPVDLEPSGPYVLVHLAVQQLDTDGTGFTRTNVHATRHLVAQLSSKLSGVIYGSSLSVYGQGSQEGIAESTPPQPETELARSRWQAEQILTAHARAHAYPAFMLRPRYVLGQGDRFVLPGLAKLVKRRMGVGHGQQNFSVIDVADYARVILQLSHLALDDHHQTRPRQCALNVGYTQAISYAALTGQIAQQIGAPAMKWRIPVTPSITRWLHRLPFKATEKLATKLELIGLSHWGRVDALAALIGTDLIGRDPLTAVAHATTHLDPSTIHPAVPHENPRQL